MEPKRNISIIIPSFQEEAAISQTIRHIFQEDSLGLVQEILVCDAASSDSTVRLAREAGARVLENLPRGRAIQMNAGAREAEAELLYFLHADTRVAPEFSRLIVEAVAEGARAGCFRLRFDESHWFLKANAWFTRFNVNALRFGDQSLFVLKEVFEQAGGFREDLTLMEDQEIVHRLRRRGSFRVLPACVMTSARKYRKAGVYRMQGLFFLVWAGYYLGFPTPGLSRWLRRRLAAGKTGQIGH